MSSKWLGIQLPSSLNKWPYLLALIGIVVQNIWSHYVAYLRCRQSELDGPIGAFPMSHLCVFSQRGKEVEWCCLPSFSPIVQVTWVSLLISINLMWLFPSTFIPPHQPWPFQLHSLHNFPPRNAELFKAFTYIQHKNMHHGNLILIGWFIQLCSYTNPHTFCTEQGPRSPPANQSLCTSGFPGSSGFTTDTFTDPVDFTLCSPTCLLHHVKGCVLSTSK